MKVLFLILGMMSAAAFAQTPNNGKEEAYKICGNLSFDSDRNKCMEIVSGASFFSVSGLSACASLSFASQILECMGRIKNNFYQPSLVNVCTKRMSFSTDRDACMAMIANNMAEDSAVDICSKNTFPSSIMACLKNVLKPYDIPVPPTPAYCDKRYVISEMDSALKMLGEYKVMPAYQRLLGLKNYLLSCMSDY